MSEIGRGIGGSTAAAELEQLAPWPEAAPPISRDERTARIVRARALMDEIGADALVIGAGASLRYFAGIGWPMTERLVAMVLPRTGDPAILCPKFERGTLEASLALPADIMLWEEHDSPFVLAADALARAKTVAIDPLLPHGMALRLAAAAPNLRLVDGTPIIDGCRAIKSEAELALLCQAKAMTLEVQRRAARILAPGIRESEVVRFIDAAHRALGASGSSFCITLFGQATAFPHGLPGDRALGPGDMVLIDTGCTVEGYHSDITRTYVFGEPDAEQSRIWEIEKAAQAAAFAAVRPGLPCAAIDAAARAVLEDAGLGPDYALPGLPHRTGHGIGLAIHEGPYLVRSDETPLAPGMCFSNEPMIVVPDRFGVRLEDHFHVTEDGARWFTEPSPSIHAPFG